MLITEEEVYDIINAADDVCHVKEGDIGWDEFTWTVTVNMDCYITLRAILDDLTIAMKQRREAHHD